MKKGAVTLFILASVLYSSSVLGQETRFKAIMLYQFTKLIGWPSLNKSTNDFVIGVYGNKRVYNLTSYYCKGKKVGSRNIKVKYYDLAKEIGKTEILYIAEGKTKYLPVISNYLGNSPTLIVTSRRGAMKYGSVANFVVVDGYMKVEMSQTNAFKRRLQISPQLKRAAVKVYNP